MKLRIPDLILMFALVAGGVLAWRTARERTRLEAEHDRLALATGDLRIGDPTKVHILALDTGEPGHYAWRIYAPANYTLRVNTSAGHSGTYSSAGPHEFIARVRFREDDAGLLNVYDHFAGGSSRAGFGDKALTELMRDRWDQITVDQLGSPEMTTVEPGAPAVLIRLKMSDKLQAEAREKLPEFDQKRYLPDLFVLRLGPDPVPPPSTPPGN